MAVFPEKMNRTEGMKPEEAIAVIESYIGYMCEQIEFTVSNIKKNADSQNRNNAQ